MQLFPCRPLRVVILRQQPKNLVSYLLQFALFEILRFAQDDKLFAQDNKLKFLQKTGAFSVFGKCPFFLYLQPFLLHIGRRLCVKPERASLCPRNRRQSNPRRRLRLCRKSARRLRRFAIRLRPRWKSDTNARPTRRRPRCRRSKPVCFPPSVPCRYTAQCPPTHCRRAFPTEFYVRQIGKSDKKRARIRGVFS